MLLNFCVGVLRVPWTCKEIQVHPNGNQSWIFIGRTGAEAETPILWQPDGKNGLIWKDTAVGKDWRREKGGTEDEMVGWHYGLKRHEFVKCQELVMDREVWSAAVHGVTKSRTRLSDWTELSHQGSPKGIFKRNNSVISCNLTLISSVHCELKPFSTFGLTVLWEMSWFSGASYVRNYKKLLIS